MQPGKNIKIFINYFLGPVLFVWLSFSIYRQIVRQPQLEASWLHIREAFRSRRIWYLAGAILLIPVNWGLEAWKWRRSVRHVYPVTRWQAFKAILSGVSFSVTMPNRVGEYLGRVMYMPEGSRLRTISVTLAGGFAQLLVTILAGITGLILLKQEMLRHLPYLLRGWDFILFGLIASGLVLGFIYFNVAGAVKLLGSILKARYIFLVEALQKFHSRLLMEIWLLSLLRYAVFLLQYILLFHLYGVYVSAAIIIPVMAVVFLSMAIIPSIALVEVWLRGEVMILLVGMFSSNTLGIGFTSVTAWFLNLILPALAGSLLILNLRIFRGRNGNPITGSDISKP